MNLNEIKALIDAMAASDLAEMEISKDGWTLRLVRRSEAAASTRPPRPTPSSVSRAVGESGLDTPPRPTGSPVVRAPLAGIVHLAPSPGEAAFVEIGQTVKAGTTLCVIEAMKVFNEVKAERDGVVEELLVAGGDEVEADQPLLRIT